MTMTHIETIELGSSAASITLSSISQDFTDLAIFVSARSTVTGTTNTGGEVAFNGSTANFSTTTLFGTGSSQGSNTRTNDIFFLPTGDTTANTYSNNFAIISNYTASQNKSISIDNVTEANATQAYILLNASLWSNTAAITSILIQPASGDFTANSTFSLYGIS